MNKPPIMTRTAMPDRRQSVTTNVAWTSPAGPDQKLVVTYGFDVRNRIREAFCSSFRASTDVCALANDACIMLSLLLQYGFTLEAISQKLGENRQEGVGAGPPASMIGAIIRKGLEIERGD
jgi:hypothetical protein